jgi:chromosome segregation ATPase
MPSSAASIPFAHKEYEKALRQLEQECRNHIKVEQQMKLHIECLQEKIDLITKEKESLKKDVELAKTEGTIEQDKLGKIIKTLEEELIVKAEKIKGQESSLKKLREEAGSLKDRLAKLQAEHERLQVVHANSSMIRSEGGPPEVLQDYSDMVRILS